MSVEIVKKYLVQQNSWDEKTGCYQRSFLAAVDSVEEGRAKFGDKVVFIPLVSDIIQKPMEPLPNLNYRDIGHEIRSAVLTCQGDEPIVLRLVMDNYDTWVLSISMTQIVSPAKEKGKSQ